MHVFSFRMPFLTGSAWLYMLTETEIYLPKEPHYLFLPASTAPLSLDIFLFSKVTSNPPIAQLSCDCEEKFKYACFY